MNKNAFYYKEHPRIKNTYVFTCNGDTTPYSDDLKIFKGVPTTKFSVTVCDVEYAIVCPTIKREVDLWGEGKMSVIYDRTFVEWGIKIGDTIEGPAFYSSREDVNIMCNLLNALGFRSFAGKKDPTYKYDISEIYIPVFDYGFGNTIQVIFNTLEFIKRRGFRSLPDYVASKFLGLPLEIRPCRPKKYSHVVYSNAGRLYVKLYHNGCFVTYSAVDYLSRIIETGSLLYNPVLSEIAKHLIDKIKGKKRNKSLCRRMENIFIYNEDRYSVDRKSIELAILLSECLKHCETI